MHATKKIMVVDDEPDITFTLCFILEEVGFEVDSFNDPISALRSFKPRYYDLLILDVKMSEMNGFELYQELKKKDNLAKVCFLTAVSELGQYEQYKKDASPKLHERYFVAKPIEADTLVKRIKVMLADNIG